ncbi:unnamed protein product [Closterium sp. NIES-65]|nr:unnamed protein product [Closterium sp. NIES-65]
MNDIPITIFGLHPSTTPPPSPPGSPEPSWMILLFKYLHVVPPDRIVAVSSSDNVVMLPSRHCEQQHLLESFLSLQSPVAFAANDRCAPAPSSSASSSASSASSSSSFFYKPHSANSAPNRFLNPGMFIGYAWALQRVLEVVVGSTQGHGSSGHTSSASASTSAAAAAAAAAGPAGTHADAQQQLLLAFLAQDNIFSPLPRLPMDFPFANVTGTSKAGGDPAVGSGAADGAGREGEGQDAMSSPVTFASTALDNRFLPSSSDPSSSSSSPSESSAGAAVCAAFPAHPTASSSSRPFISLDHQNQLFQVLGARGAAAPGGKELEVVASGEDVRVKAEGTGGEACAFQQENWVGGGGEGAELGVERPASGDARLKWERKNQKAFAQFCNALVPDELIRLVREFGGKTELGSAPVDGGARAVTRIPAGTAAAYIRVKGFYLQRGLCNRMALSEELSSLKMKEGEGVAAYWARAEDLRSKYLAAGGKEEVEEWMMRILKGLPPHFEMLKVVLNNQSSSLTKDQLLTSLRSEEMRIGVAPRSDGVATFGAGTKVGSSGRGNWVKGGKHGDSGSSSDTNSGRWGQGKGKAGVLDFPWGSKGMAPRGLCHGCWDEGHAWQRCPHRPKGGIPAFLQRGGRGSNGKAQVADEEEQDDKAEAVVGEAVAAVGEEQPREGWWIDSGASHNFTPYASDFKSKLQPPEVRGVRLGDGRVVKAVGMGEVPVVGAGGQLLRIQKVHLVPEMHTRLLSVPHLTSRDVIVTFKGKRCVLQRGERVLAIGEKERGRDHGLVRMFLPLAQGTQGSALAAKSSSSFSPLTLAHRRLGHTAPTTLQQMARGNSVQGLEIGGGNTDCSPCEPCLLGKSARKPFPHEASRALGPLDEVHMDLWGPVRTPSLGGAVYVLSLIDDFTRRVWSFPLPNKESAIVAKVLRQWHKDVELECGRKLKAVRSDRGGEFLGEAVKAWKAEFGIKTQLSVADTPQQNGVVERWHRTMAEGIRTLLVDSGLPARLWGEALMWVVWVKNRVTHSALPASITPMETWSGQKPHVGMARIWGCMGSVMLHGHEKGGKLDARAVMCVCVGVDMESKGWRMLDPSIMRIRIARDVDFLENVMWKDWDKAKEFGELLQDAAAISQLLPLPLSPPSATADDVEMPLSPLPPAPLSVSVQQQPTPLQKLSGPSVIQRRSATQATSSSSSSGQRSIPLSTGAPPSPATTSPPPVTGLQVLGIQSGTGGEEVGGDAGVVEGMLCLAREVEGVALAGVSTGQGGACSEVPDEGSRNGTWSTEEGVAADVKVYQSLIGSLMYAAVTTRPDMSFTVNTLAQSCVAPRRIHMRAALRALSLQLHENLERIGMRVIAAKAKASFAGGVVF